MGLRKPFGFFGSKMADFGQKTPRKTHFPVHKVYMRRLSLSILSIERAWLFDGGIDANNAG
jgi:hypothetical protein